MHTECTLLMCLVLSSGLAQDGVFVSVHGCACCTMRVCARVMSHTQSSILHVVHAVHAGGERKRVSVGHELLINPAVLMWVKVRI